MPKHVRDDGFSMKVFIKATKKIEDVNASYAANYLIPKGLAVLATDKVLADVAKEEEKQHQAIEQRRERRDSLAQSLTGKIITLKVPANAEGELYGSVGKQQIKKALKAKETMDIKLNEPIKHTGEYPLEIKIGKNRVKVTVKVIAS